MPDQQELFKIMYDLLDEVDLYYHQVYNLYFSNAYNEFETSRGRRNYDRIIKELKNIDIPDPNNTITKTMELDELKDYLGTLLRIILGDKYEEDIKIAKALVTPIKYSQHADVKTEHRTVREIEFPGTFKVSNKHNSIQLVNIVNAEATVLSEKLYKNFNNTITNIHYKKLPGIIAAYIAIYELSKILQEDSLVPNYEEFCTHEDVGYAKEIGKEIIKLMPEYRKKNVQEHNEHSTFTFLLSSVYSTNLVTAYLEDEISFITKYREMLEGNISVPEYLKFYGVELRNRNTVDTYLEKIDKVGKRRVLK